MQGTKAELLYGFCPLHPSIHYYLLQEHDTIQHNKQSATHNQRRSSLCSNPITIYHLSQRMPTNILSMCSVLFCCNYTRCKLCCEIMRHRQTSIRFAMD